MSMPSVYGGWIENLRYHVEVLATPDPLEEVVARVSEVSAAHAVFDLTVSRAPGEARNPARRRVLSGGAIELPSKCNRSG
jgi:hypothetical protein